MQKRVRRLDMHFAATWKLPSASGSHLAANIVYATRSQRVMRVREREKKSVVDKRKEEEERGSRGGEP